MASVFVTLVVALLSTLTSAGLDGQTMKYDLSGTDRACMTIDVPTAANACGIHIHSGTKCQADNVGGHFWNKTFISKDPWRAVRYTTSSNGEAKGGPMNIMTGLADNEVIGRVVVVHDASGARVACSSLGDDLKAKQFTKYPGYAGELSVRGTVDFASVVEEPTINSQTGVVTDVWGIPNSGLAEEGGRPDCLTQGMQKPIFFQAGLATSACEVTGIPCEVTSTGISYVAYDAAESSLNAFVTFQHLNPFANGDFGSPDEYVGAETPIMGMHIHKGSSSVNGPVAVFFCGVAPLPSLHGLPSCSQRNDQVYRGYFLQNDGTFSTQASADFIDLMENKVTDFNAQDLLYYNLHTTYSFAETQGHGLIRAQLVATGAPPAFALRGCHKAVEESATTPSFSSGCKAAVPGSACFRDVVWAMSHGIQQHPQWYPDLSASSSFDDFQHFLHKTGRNNGNCAPPCDRNNGGRRLQVSYVLV